MTKQKNTNIPNEMEWAILTGDVDSVKKKLETGFNANEVGNTGFTTLSFAILQDEIGAKKRVQIVGLLLQHGADPRIQSPVNLCDSFEEVSQKQSVVESLIRGDVRESAEIDFDESGFQECEKMFLKAKFGAQKASKILKAKSLESEEGKKQLTENTGVLVERKGSYEVIFSSLVKRSESLKDAEHGDGTTGGNSPSSSVSSSSSFSSSLAGASSAISSSK